jgi:very-short-patch-repair endonuclease
MYICEKCNKEHDGSYGSGRFCSSTCAHKRVLSDYSRKKLSKSRLGVYNTRRKIKCDKCSKEIDSSNFNRHYKACEGHKERFTINENWKQLNGKYKCPYCSNQYSKMGIINHILYKHKGKQKKLKNNFKKYLERIKNGEINHWAKGETKETNKFIKKQSEKLRERYKSGELSGSFKGRKHTKEAKEKIRKARIEYLKKNKCGTAWHNKSKGLMSYGEEVLHNIFAKEGIYKKYDVVNEFPVYPYFIDFAFINERVAVEFDGKCHFENGNKRIEHDIKRDEYLKNKGWRIYRIPYFELNSFKIKDLIIFLDKKKEKKFSDNLITYNKIKERKEELNVQKRKETEQKKKEQINNIKTELLNSLIDFSKFGWVEKASKIIGITPQKVNVWMKKNMKEFYEEKCFKKFKNN